MPDFSAASRESPTLPKYPAKPSMKHAILVRGAWNIGQSYHLSLSLLPSTPYRSYPPSCHFFVVIPCWHLPLIHSTLWRATFLWLSPCCHLPPIDHTLRRATFVVIPHILCMTHPSRNPRTHQRVAQYRQSRTRTSGVRQNSQYHPKLRQMTCLPNVPQRIFVTRVLDKSHSDSIWRFAMLSVHSVMYTGLHMKRHSAPQI